MTDDLSIQCRFTPVEAFNMHVVDEKKLVPWRTFRRGRDGRKIMHDGLLGRIKWIYHLLPWKFAKTIIEDRCLRLSPVREWKTRDPYEEWWCNIIFHKSSKLSKTHAHGQSWTTSHYDEPMWRMAGFARKPDQLPTVRIMCRPSEILKAGQRFIENSAGSLFLAKLRYRRENELWDLAQTAKLRKEVTRTAAELLVHKRNAYRFENEVRLLWVSEVPAPDGIRIHIDPREVISEIMISPYATKEQVKEVRDYCDKHGIPVRKSLTLKTPLPV